MSTKQHQLINLIHHNKDADGFLSMELFKQFINILNNNSKDVHLGLFPHGYNYEHQLENPNEFSMNNKWMNTTNCYGIYVFTDCTPPLWWLEELKEQLEEKVVQVIIVDHHKAACEKIIELYNDSIQMIYEDGVSASMILYKSFIDISVDWQTILFQSLNLNKSLFDNIKSYFNKEYNLIKRDIEKLLDCEVLRNIVQLVNDYDVWNWINDYHVNNNIKPYLMYRGITERYCEPLKYDGQYLLRDLFIVDSNKQKVFTSFNNIGENIYQKDMAEFHNIKYYELEVNHENPDGLSLGVIINNSVNFFVTDKVLDYYDFVIFWDKVEDTDDLFKVSVRSAGEFNCSDFAKKICNGKGGGHKNAAGGSLTTTEFMQLYGMLTSGNSNELTQLGLEPNSQIQKD